ncbi:MAG: hypothetical protein ACM3O3_07415 [Syntrophothermus sp.]
MVKVCNSCGIEKDIEEYSKFKQRDGSQSYRNVCKSCRYRQRKNNKGKEENKTMLPPKKEIKKDIPGPEVKPEIKKEPAIKKEKSIGFQDMDTILDSSLIIDILTRKDKRIKTTLTVDAEIKSKLDKYAKQSKFNTSDILSMILYNFFENNNIE